MSIHRVFAQNLRDQCLAKGTIAAVCKGAGINRQQFNRYLSATSLPNATTLARICNFLGIREAELFKEKASRPFVPGLVKQDFPDAQEQDAQEHEAALGLPEGVFRFLKSSGSWAFPEGYYYCYFPAQDINDFVMRTLVWVKRSGAHHVFKRLTVLRSADAEKKPLIVTKHVGLVFSTPSASYFVAENSTQQREISLLVMENRGPAGSKVRRGLGLISGYSHPMACQVSMELVSSGPGDLRKLIQSLGLIQLNDLSLNPIVKTLYSGMAPTIPNQLSLKNVEVALLSEV